MSDKIDLGFAGCGANATGALMPLAAKVEEFKLHAFMDIAEDRAKEACEKNGGSYHTTDLDRMVNDPELDAVVIATLPDTHVSIAKQFLAAGKHVFLQKPPAATLDQCRELVQAARSSKAKAMVAYCYRLSPLTNEIKNTIKEPKAILARMMVARLDDDDYYAAHPETGGRMLELACHNFDLTYWLAGARPVRVSAAGGNLNHPGTDIVDNFAVNVTFENGTIASLIGVDCGSAKFERKWLVEVYGNGTTARIEGFKKLFFYGEREDEINSEYNDGIGITKDMEAFKDCITGKKNPVPVEEGIVSTVMMLKAFETLKTGESVEINMEEYLS